jgi:hypothetical protein
MPLADFYSLASAFFLLLFCFVFVQQCKIIVWVCYDALATDSHVVWAIYVGLEAASHCPSGHGQVIFAKYKNSPFKRTPIGRSKITDTGRSGLYYFKGRALELLPHAPCLSV